ncbi:helix-turn-helix domain-containing protein [Salinicoccus sp. Marseille-QA3877]
MDFLDRYIKDRSERSPEFKSLIEDPVSNMNEGLRAQFIKLRLDLSLTQEEFAKSTDVPETLITNIENDIQYISIGRLQSILAKTNTGARLSIEIKED